MTTAQAIKLNYVKSIRESIWFAMIDSRIDSVRNILIRCTPIRKGRRVRRIEVLRDTPTEFELRTRQQIYSGGGRKGRQEKGMMRHRNRGRKP